MTEERCQFSTTTPETALRQAARTGSRTRYQRCKNRARHTITITSTSLAWQEERQVQCCGLHKRLHEERGWLP